MVYLKGIACLHAATPVLQERFPDINIDWDIHSLADFSAKPIAETAKEYDLIVFDHPFVGDAWRDNALIDLTDYLKAEDIQQLKNDVVDSSVNIYAYQGGLWGLPLDSACQIAVHRPDLCDDIGLAHNTLDRMTLDEIIGKVQSSGKQIAIAFSGVSTVMTFFTLCYKMGFPPFQTSNLIVPDSVGKKAVQIMKNILNASPPDILDWDTIACLENMSIRSDLVYCPYIFGFSAYSTDTYTSSDKYHPLIFTDNPLPAAGSNRGGIIGGAGVGISSDCVDKQSAAKIALELMKPDIQKMMALNMAQPSRRSAWVDEEVNRSSRDFYINTIESIDNGYLRPRDPGFVPKQDEAGRCLEDHLRKGSDNIKIIQELNEILLFENR